MFKLFRKWERRDRHGDVILQRRLNEQDSLEVSYSASESELGAYIVAGGGDADDEVGCSVHVGPFALYATTRRLGPLVHWARRWFKDTVRTGFNLVVSDDYGSPHLFVNLLAHEHASGGFSAVWEPADWLLGKAEYEEECVEKINTLITLPEGSYDAEIEIWMVRHVRPGLPPPAWKYRGKISIPDGVDMCDKYGYTYAISFPTVERKLTVQGVVTEFICSVLKSRVRHTNSTYAAHPSAHAECH